MIVSVFSFVLFFTFIALSILHFYWLFGGDWALEKVIPSKFTQAQLLAVPKFATLFVALGLLTFALLYLVKSGFIEFPIPNLVQKFAYWFIPIIFTIRAIGEFNYVGLFKKVKDTEFGRADTKIFVPLCLGIGILGFVIQVLGVS